MVGAAHWWVLPLVLMLTLTPVANAGADGDS